MLRPDIWFWSEDTENYLRKLYIVKLSITFREITENSLKIADSKKRIKYSYMIESAMRQFEKFQNSKSDMK
jgi:hypothetical protein